jgi:DNA ligase-1
LPAQLSRWLDELDETGRWALLKLVTGAMRADRDFRAAGEDCGRSARRQGPARDRIDVAGLAPPYLDLFAWLEAAPKTGQPRSGAVPSGDAGACDRG